MRLHLSGPACICLDLHGSAPTRVDMQGSVWLCADLLRSAKIWSGLCKSASMPACPRGAEKHARAVHRQFTCISCTVAILAQGTHWAVAVTQAYSFSRARGAVLSARVLGAVLRKASQQCVQMPGSRHACPLTFWPISPSGTWERKARAGALKGSSSPWVSLQRFKTSFRFLTQRNRDGSMFALVRGSVTGHSDTPRSNM